MSKLDIDAAHIAILDSGERVLVYPGEGADDDCFAGELLDPPERMVRMNTHVSCLWDRSKVASLEFAA